MPHATSILRHRLPQNVNKVPYNVSKPLTIRDFIIKGSDKTKLHGICLVELSHYFLCLKQHGFKEEPCSDLFKQFQACYNAAKAQRAANLEKGAGKSSVQKINSIMKQYGKYL